VWLLPVFSFVARLAARIYYKVRFAGPAIPEAGPVLLVANHPNSLLDPTLVVASGLRPVRFLAKAPLFSDRKIGWLMRAAGAIPVYRRSDDPSLMARNEDSFEAVFQALGSGAAVGIFPEGVSHSEPSMAPLRTGAARIALGAVASTGRSFPIVPIGLSFREKDIFRSDAFVVRGSSLQWGDLASRGQDDVEAVRELTSRIDVALRGVTVNLTDWEDRPIVEGAVRIWEAERGTPSRAGERLERLEFTTRMLAKVRANGDSAGIVLSEDVKQHIRRLSRLGLRPSDLVADVGAGRGVSWAARRLYLVLPAAVVLGAVGAALFWVPYQLTGAIVNRLNLKQDVRSTWKLMIGAVLYVVWLAILVSITFAMFGFVAAISSALLIPTVAMSGLAVREWWQSSLDDVRRFFLLRSRGSLIEKLRTEQQDLAYRLKHLVQPT